jgi:hypothetical protein
MRAYQVGGRGEGLRGMKRGEDKPAGAGKWAILKERERQKRENLGRIDEPRKEKGEICRESRWRKRGREGEKYAPSLRCCPPRK